MVSKSINWKAWYAKNDLKTCLRCVIANGKIYSIHENVTPKPPLHWCCRCKIAVMGAIVAGSASSEGENGADFWLKHYNKLPVSYIAYNEAISNGWVPELGNLTEVLPNRIIGGSVFKNKENKLPNASGRIWYEADINYSGGRREADRVLFSNDRLIFATYDHYQTFIEII